MTSSNYNETLLHNDQLNQMVEPRKTYDYEIKINKVNSKYNAH